ncbi:hypothetical protein U5801_27290 [Lamprobacter modestohalophilus]|uniref:hypothetical protein n=1 Tax=Lamprobacter modestohalophilus TaxID=1064514 RepID=UPI002ADED991|nr:hypothetical protein [Lamprobacter modestohalophilus]MEA1053480.1 hypothetical protein [Lamprobacter modestohalophilus]
MEQVLALLQHPERLQQEYEQRLNRLQQAHASHTDTDVLEKQHQHLKQGKSRLIDSYTEGLIDKSDFDPKMAQPIANLSNFNFRLIPLANKMQAKPNCFW